MNDSISGSLPFGAITVGLDPVIFRLGHLHVGWYGLAVALAIGAGLWLAHHEVQRGRLPHDAVWSVGIWVAGGGFVGARLLHVVDRWSEYSDDLLGIVAFQRGGLAIEGALVGGLVAGVLAARLNRIPVLPLADAVAPGVILGQAIGRLGCLVTGDALGGPTSLPWGVAYTNAGSMASDLGVPYQPVFAYEGLWDLLVLAVLWRLRLKVTRPGALFGTYLMLYAVGKFGVTFLREERVWLAGLQHSHLLALVLFAIGLAVFAYSHRNDTTTRTPSRVRTRRLEKPGLQRWTR